MQPRIMQLYEKKLIGKSIRTTLATDNPPALWGSFMPRKKEVINAVGTDLYSLQIYDSLKAFDDFTPNTEFKKWAAIETTDFNSVPEGLEKLTLPAGLYAVFVHKGAADSFKHTMQYIFEKWLLTSEYELDDRPHFELLGEKYKNNDPNSEEEVWVPIKRKKLPNK